MDLRSLLGVDLPVLQAPMAGVQGSALAAAVTDAGGLSSLSAAMLTPGGLRAEFPALRGLTAGPFNVNFFCHRTPSGDAGSAAEGLVTGTPQPLSIGRVWQQRLTPPTPAHSVHGKRFRQNLGKNLSRPVQETAPSGINTSWGA